MFNLSDYEDVDTRIHKFYETYADGEEATAEAARGSAEVSAKCCLRGIPKKSMLEICAILCKSYDQ